jgi:hypothetical protein
MEFKFGKGGGQSEGTGQTYIRRDYGEKVFDGTHANGFHHGATISVGIGYIGHVRLSVF